MMDLIDRKAAIEAMKKWATQPVIMKTRCFEPRGKAIVLDMIGTVKEQPTVDAVPVVHGRWVEYPECLRFYGATSKDHIVCSACHAVWSIMDNDTEKFDFCPHCGAKMDNETEDKEE